MPKSSFKLTIFRLNVLCVRAKKWDSVSVYSVDCSRLWLATVMRLKNYRWSAKWKCEFYRWPLMLCIFQMECHLVFGEMFRADHTEAAWAHAKSNSNYGKYINLSIFDKANCQPVPPNVMWQMAAKKMRQTWWVCVCEMFFCNWLFRWQVLTTCQCRGFATHALLQSQCVRPFSERRMIWSLRVLFISTQTEYANVWAFVKRYHLQMLALLRCKHIKTK